MLVDGSGVLGRRSEEVLGVNGAGDKNRKYKRNNMWCSDSSRFYGSIFYHLIAEAAHVNPAPKTTRMI